MKNNARIVLTTVVVTLLVVGAFFLILAQHQKMANFPFEVKYRKAITGNGYVDQIINNSDRSQSVKVTLNNPTLNRTKVYSLIVDAHQFKEIGYLEGWPSSSGDTVTLEWNSVSKKFNIP
jgi:hypothetical protein